MIFIILFFALFSLFPQEDSDIYQADTENTEQYQPPQNDYVQPENNVQETNNIEPSNLRADPVRNKTTTSRTSEPQVQRNKDGSLVVKPDPNASLPKIVESFDFKKVDVLTLVKNICKLTGKAFILNQEILKAKDITIINPNPISVQEAYDVFLNVLDTNGLAVVKAANFLSIVSKAKVTGGVSLYTGQYYPHNDEFITRLIKIKNIDAVDLQKMLSGSSNRNNGFLGGSDLKIGVIEDTNTLIVTGTGSRIAELDEIISLLDIEGYNNRLEVIHIANADATELVKILDDVLVKEKSSGGGSAKKSSSFNKMGIERYSKIFADDRTNSVVVLANDAGIKTVREFIRKLDFEIEGDSNIQVYYVKNARAKDLSTTLSAAIGDGKGGTIFKEVKITADETINALVISAKPKQYESIKYVIDKLDKKKNQVLFETITMEVSLSDDSSFGISSNYAMSSEVPRAVGFDPGVSSQNNIMNFLTNPAALSGLILGFGSKKTVDVNIGGKDLTLPSLSAFITALEKNSEANVLQRPTITVSDNEKATIRVLDKIPVIKGSSISQGLSTQNIESVEVGLTLMITPHISDSDFVKLDIDQETSNVTDKAPRDLATTTVATNNRQIVTSIVVKDADTVVIGGLYRDDVSTTYNKVPILGDIPIIGWFFKGKTSRASKTNLLVFITPHIIRDSEKHNELTNMALQSRKGFIKKNLGGEDKFKDFVKSVDKKTSVPKQEDYLPKTGVKLIN